MKKGLLSAKILKISWHDKPPVYSVFRSWQIFANLIVEGVPAQPCLDRQPFCAAKFPQAQWSADRLPIRLELCLR